MRAVGLLVAMGVVASATGCDTPPEALGGVSAALAHGYEEPALFELGPESRKAIGAFVVDGRVRCTGALVGARHVLTARHCFSSSAELARADFVLSDELGRRPGRALAPLTPIALRPHPTLDVALVTLASPPRRVVRPLALARSSPEALVGSELEVAGAGLGSGGRLMFGAFTVTGFDMSRLAVEADGGRGQCAGDSGGPWLVASQSAAAPTIVAVTSASAPNCGHPAYGVRADVIVSWVEAELRAANPARPLLPRAVRRP